MYGVSKQEVAENLLKNMGYTKLEFLAQGAINTVFKCENPKGELVAAKVVFEEEFIKDEIKSTKELESIMPKGFKKYFNKFLSWTGINKSRAKKDKHYFKYTNVPILKKHIKNAHKYLKNAAILEAPLVDGDTFNKFLRDENAIKILEELKRMAKNALKALHLLHRKGKVHLDIKPQNIFQIQSAKGKTIYMLGDFGSINYGIKEVDKNHIKILNTLGSTPEYQAPEHTINSIIEKKQLAKLDIYSLGASLYHLYLDRVLNQNYMGRSTIISLQSENPRNPQSTEEENFFDFIRCLTKTYPQQRPTSSQALKHKFLK